METGLQFRQQSKAWGSEVPRYISADLLPDVAVERVAARMRATTVLEQNREILRNGDFDDVPLPVDALGTARRLQNAERGSDEYEQLREGLEIDCRRLFQEAFRANTWEYFAPLRRDRDPLTGRYTAHGVFIQDLTDGGLSPVAEPEEQDRRINESVEEDTYRAISTCAGRLALRSVVQVQTISECTDWAIEKYARNPKAGNGGYVPKIQKFMIRNVAIDTDNNCRYDEQIGLSGEYIDHEVIVEGLQVVGAIDSGSRPTKTEIHGMQAIALEQTDLIDFVKLLDQIASDRHGITIFLGEPLGADESADYGSVREQARKREAALTDKSKALAEYIIELEAANVDGWVAERLVADFVQKNLFEEARKDPVRAAQMFDEQTASGYATVIRLQQAGWFNEAQRLLSQVEAAAPAPGYCGAGSCGLSSVEASGNELNDLKKLLKAESGDKLASDEERPCRDCGKMSVVYAYNQNKVNKACTNCNAFESKKTK